MRVIESRCVLFRRAAQTSGRLTLFRALAVGSLVVCICLGGAACTESSDPVTKPTSEDRMGETASQTSDDRATQTADSAARPSESITLDSATGLVVASNWATAWLPRSVAIETIG